MRRSVFRCRTQISQEWFSSDETRIPLIKPPEPQVDLYAKTGLVPHGVRFVAQQADKTEPMRKGIGRVIFDDGIYHSWSIKASLPINSGRHIGTAGGSSSIEWVYETFGAISYLYEIHNGYLWFNPDIKPESVKLPIVSKEEIILSVWYGINTLLNSIGGIWERITIS